MNSEPPGPRPRILFLFSDTGGGHRSAAEAIIEALHLEFGDQFGTQMVDVFKDYAPRPLNRVPDLYPKMVKVPQAWGLGYHLSDGNRRARLITATTWPYVRSAIRNLVAQHPSDLIVSVHLLATGPVLRALGSQRPPFITVVTDLVSVHALWYHRRADLCIVPTAAARQRGLIYGMPSEKMKVVGLPVADRFCQPAGDRRALREKLGWPQDLPVILLVGGGEGMGPLEKTALAIAEANFTAALVIMAGRNQRLKADLRFTAGRCLPTSTGLCTKCLISCVRLISWSPKPGQARSVKRSTQACR
jgi:1,2-diacylglycerol 3-beta-galactosyltransferase